MTMQINGSGGLVFPDATTQGTGGYTGFRNRVINGAMMIDQRNGGASVVATTPASFSVDRWALQYSQSGKYTIQQNAGSATPPVGFSNYVGIVSSSAYAITATDYFGIAQPIEGFNVADLGWGTANAATVTLSFKVYSSLTGVFGGAIRNYAANRSYPFTYTISAVNTWTSISITIAGDTTGSWPATNAGWGSVIFGIGVGSTYSGTSGSWAATNYLSATGATSVVGTNGATFYITGVQLEKGSVATPFEVRQYGTEFNLCQRYFETNYNEGQAVGSDSGLNGTWVAVAINAVDFYDYGRTTFAVTKRTSPTINQYNPTTGAGNYYDFIVAGANGNVGARYSGTAGFSQYCSTGFLADHAYAVRWTASAEL